MNVERLKWSLKSGRKKQRVLKAACDLLRIWPETNGLLDLCERQNVAIRFNEELFGTETDGQFRHNRTTGDRAIELKPYNNPQDLAVALIHELRHLWQAEQWGLAPGKNGLAEPDARTALLATRVKEADAFAFTNLMISRLNHAVSDVRDAEKLEKKLRAGKAPLPENALQEQVDDFLAGRLAGRLEADRQKMGDDFIKALTWLDSYDRETLREYHRRYIRPDPVSGKPQDHLTSKDGPVLDLAAIRRLLRTGTVENMPPYLEDLTDKDFTAAVLRDVKPAVSGVVDLMTAFEKAAARPAEETRRQRLAIEAAMQRIRSASP